MSEPLYVTVTLSVGAVGILPVPALMTRICRPSGVTLTPARLALSSRYFLFDSGLMSAAGGSAAAFPAVSACLPPAGWLLACCWLHAAKTIIPDRKSAAIAAFFVK